MEEVVIPSIFVKESVRFSSLIRKVNDELRVLCSIDIFYFISNDSYTRKYLCRNGVHSTEAGNIVNHLNEIFLVVNIRKLDWHDKICSEEK